MAKFQMQIETDHPILLLADASPSFQIPERIEGFATASADCVCFYVLSDVDGASIVTVTDEECDAPGMKAFTGSINASTGVLIVADSASFRYLSIPVPKGPVLVEIWADDDMNPDWVWIKLGAIRK